MATDNAISVLSKFVNKPYCDVFPEAFSTWLASLPLTADRVEAIANHDLLVRLVEQRDPRVIGQPQSLVKVAQVLVRALGGGTRLIDGEVGKRAAALLHQLVSQ